MTKKTKEKKKNKIGAVLVVGGGIGGIQSSLDLADSGFKVYLLDKSPSIGGVMAQLDKTFPTNDCAMCIMAPKLVGAGRHLNIQIITNTEIKGIKGKPGNFHVEILKRARYIDIEKCTGCGVCAQECPIDAIDVYNEGLNLRRAIYIPYPQGVPLAYSIDRDKCVGCRLCESLCLADAIKYDDKDEAESLGVGAVILSPGFDEFNPKIKGIYGYGSYPNVLTSIEFERILSASGPYKGHLFRPSDSAIPKNIAFIQCVGSRDTECGNGYCSSVCCMYATKEAIIAKEHADQGVEATIFFMDMRSYGKDFDRYYERAKDEYGIKYVRAQVGSISETPGTNNLRLKYECEDGELAEEEFDMVILSVGLVMPKGAKELAVNLGIDLNKYGFCKTNEFSPMETSKPGIFVSGAFQGPKDIPETVTQASGAASLATGLISSARGTQVTEKVYPPEIDVSEQPPRIGVFVCHCGINIGGFVTVPQVVEYAKTLDNVVYAENNLYTCSQDTQKKITEMIKEHNLNRVVVASCTPRTHEPLFQETLREAGLNPHLFEMANIRDQCSWIHMHEPEEATIKAKDLVRMAVAKARLIEPLQSLPLDVTQKGLVIGGGLAGMVAAIGIAKQGYEVYLIEREKELGGNLRNIYYTLEGNNVQACLKSLIEQIEGNLLIHVYKDTHIEKIEGFVGNYKTTVKTLDRSTRSTTSFAGNAGTHRSQKASPASPDLSGRSFECNDTAPTVELEHGIIIVAIGGKEYQPTEYLYGKHDRVISQLELEKRIATLNPELSTLNSIVMIQCVGSRDDSHPYCSRTCCSQAIKNALKLKEINPNANIYILYRDVRTYGFREDYYREAREAGVTFIRYDEYNKPEIIPQAESLKVSLKDPLLNYQLILDAELLILSLGTVPQPDCGEVAEMLKIPLNEDKFFLEAHVKLRPVDFATEGIFLAGMAHSPKFIDETIAQANAAVSRACTIISKDKYLAEPTIAEVNEDICDGCGICEPVCEYGAIEIVTEEKEGREMKKVKLTEALCKGCGTCIAACPSGAMEQKGFKSEQLVAMVDAALEGV
ncbi:NAD(P)H-quinone oxidoreductase subunit I, chloroplastic [subsurface metagenome]